MVTKTIQFPQQNKILAKFPYIKRVIAEQELNSPQLPSPTKLASSRKPLPESLASSNLAPQIPPAARPMQAPCIVSEQSAAASKQPKQAKP
jgi:hypothetical protein